jgi:competence protein ComEC
MNPAYEIGDPQGWQVAAEPPPQKPASAWRTDAASVLCVATLVAAMWQGAAAAAFGAAAVALVARRVRWGLVVLVLGLAAAWWATHSWEQAERPQLGAFHGWAVVAGDARPVGAGTELVLTIEGQRFEVLAYGPLGTRIASRTVGEPLEVDGVRRPLRGPFARRAHVRHIVGRFELHALGAVGTASPLARSATAVRSRLRAAAEQAMPGTDAALFSGLVIGDDAREPATMVAAFRTAGLSHLTAVSGQNVGFVLAVAALGVRRLRPWWRWTATIGVIIWFVVLTRVEPSVVRAGVMAGWSATAFVLGRVISPVRSLVATVAVLAVIDPLLVWSVAFWLSVCATAGVCVVGPWLQRRLIGPRWVVDPLAVTLGAQVGVLLPSWLVFHRLSALGVAANLLAVPVGGFVMLYGIPAGIAATVAPRLLGVVIMLPATVGTRWVAAVADLVARFEPHGAVAAVCWIGQWVAVSVLVVWQRGRTGWAAPRASVER